jgi:hypothetical protein
MFKLSSEITIGSYSLRGLVSVEISSSWELLTDTCKISLPSKIWHAGKFTNLAASQLLKRGDAVTVKLGYDNELYTEFEGFVTKVQSGSPLVVECEDHAWLLKKGSITKSYRQVSLAQLLNDITSIPKGIISDVSLGRFRISNATPAQVVQELKNTYGLNCFFRGRKMFCGLAYPSVGLRFGFAYGRNIIEETSELVYRKADEIDLKVKAISIMPDNSKHEVEVGSSDGELRTLNFYNIPKSDLRKLAEEQAAKLRSDGFQGSFETFGFPSVKHGDVVSLSDPRSDLKGSYLVKAVTKNFSAAGYRQRIEIDRQS